MNWTNVRYEAFDVPVFVLQKGIEKLIKYGMETFLQYSKESGLSFCDINRIISKARIAYGKKGLREFACPAELRQERLYCYTKQYRYPKETALEIIKKIDSLYSGEQFIPDPRELNKLTNGMLKKCNA